MAASDEGVPPNFAPRVLSIRRHGTATPREAELLQEIGDLRALAARQAAAVVRIRRGSWLVGSCATTCVGLLVLAGVTQQTGWLFGAALAVCAWSFAAYWTSEQVRQGGLGPS